MKIAFWDNQLNERGTSVRVFNYAYYNRAILGNESIILYEKRNAWNVDPIINKFKKEFPVHAVDDFNEVDELLQRERCDLFYITKSGEYDGKVSNVCKTAVHCVFHCHSPHGDIYSSISPWVKGNNGQYPCVFGHMIALPDHSENMREELGIPDTATVFGRYGGQRTFNILFVKKAVYNIAKENPTIYFLFANTNRFCESLPNIIHLDMIIDPHEKVRFINTCDAKIHARAEGETFGASVAEFSSKNKPVITTKSGDLCHIHFLGEKCLLYNGYDDLCEILTSFDRRSMMRRDWNAYRDFTPENIMYSFKREYIDG